VASPESFETRLARSGWTELRAAGVETLQINLGYLCNQACLHCHVGAGPNRPEIMSRETMEQALAVLRRHPVPTVDLTGGAPEMVPGFGWLLDELRRLGRHVIVRHNFTVQFEPGREHLPELFRDHRVEIIGSLPCYTAERTDAQRGSGAFENSIEAMRRLNAVGYGREGSGLVLDLVYNPGGATLPPPQGRLERDYRIRLREDFGVTFNSLFTMVNMPIARFRGILERTGRLESYMHELAGAYNPETVEHLMCRRLVSVGWDGTLYDCDFNQMLHMALRNGRPGPAHVTEFDPPWIDERVIRTGPHCYGCTAGAGSSCGGALAP
jgi:radical SAM/Cys-rich protein